MSSMWAAGNGDVKALIAGLSPAKLAALPANLILKSLVRKTGWNLQK